MNASPAPTTSLDLGGTTLTYVPDGEFRAEPAVAYPSGHEDLFTDGLDVVDENGMLVLSVGALLLTTGDRRVLVDAGIGARTIPLVRPGTTRDAYMRGGTLLQNLHEIGVEPDEVDAVLLTHLHADHVGWLGDESADGAPTFPNAEYWVTDEEREFWSRPEHDGDPVGPRPHELRIVDARRRHLVEGSEPVEGVRAVRTAGHTPGHVAFSVAGTRARALVVGDAVHCPAEVLHPGMAWVGDHDAATAARTREGLADRVARDGAVLVGPHFPDAVFRRYDPAATPPLTPHAA
ncbi:MBL fold metallo-hydrolase [Kineococcus sp. SYSU DK005]|uniref:MBL fold metallo-hydrolase n=1 Tax=Kineococcus sp. SYSU DK005 TaxID=3383126 RepID=UPI003D7C6815